MRPIEYHTTAADPCWYGRFSCQRRCQELEWGMQSVRWDVTITSKHLCVSHTAHSTLYNIATGFENVVVSLEVLCM